MTPGVIQRAYAAALERCRLSEQRGGAASAYCRVFRAAIRSAVPVLACSRRLSFPERATGGWWWIWRWRFEFLMGWLEPESLAVCRRFIRPGMTVVDIGAHIGYYTRFFSHWVGRGGRVLAFEPNPENFAVLQRNLAGTKYANVELFPMAVSAQDGVLPLYVSPGHSNHSLLAGYTPGQDVIEVKTTTLDSFLAARGGARVDFLKCDAEGAEPLVLAGMRETIARSPWLNLLMEYNPPALRCGDTPPREFLGRLERAGFDVRAILPNGLLAPVSGEGDESFNIFCRGSANTAPPD